MQTDLFVHFAEIAGVFVGFGALISVRSARPTDLHDLVYIQGVLGVGVWVVIAALLPIVVSRYGVDGQALWRPCALGSLAIWVAFTIALNRTSASRSINRNPDRLDRLFPLIGLPLHLVTAGSLLLVVLGVWSGEDEALYVTALTAGVIFAGSTLLISAMAQTNPTAANEPGEGGSDPG